MPAGLLNDPQLRDVTPLKATAMDTLHALFEDSHSFMCVIIGPEYRYGFSNRKNRELLGVTEIIGKTVAEVAPELIEQGFGTLVAEVYASGQPFIGHGVPMHPKGSDSLLYMDFIYQPILDASGSSIGIVAVGHDVTEHREALLAADAAKLNLESSAQDLGDENAQLRQTLDNLPQMVWLTGPDGEPNYFSRYWCEFTGVTRKNIAEGWVDLFHPDDREPAWDLWMHSIQTGEPYQIEYRLRHHSGGYRYVLTRARPERNGAGEIVRWYGTCTDINERVTAEQRVLHLRNELVHASRLSAMGSMAATVAHEVNQPLQAVASYVAGLERMLERGAPFSETQLVLSEIKEVSVRAGSIIKRLRELALGQKPMRASTAVAEVIAQSIDLATAGRLDEIDVLSECPDSLFVYADPVQVQQVLTNLIRNACQALEEVEKGRVAVTARRVNGRVLFSVEDNGPGLPHHMISGIFDGFLSTKPGGMGVGLAISRTMVEASGGRIWAQNKPGGGAIFSFSLPAED